MVKKAIAVTAFASGYVLGARAGRDRYEQIRQFVLRIKADALVAEALTEVALDERPIPSQRTHG
jgi:hypothetical protein